MSDHLALARMSVVDDCKFHRLILEFFFRNLEGKANQSAHYAHPDLA